MKLLSLKLFNFRPFYGEHQLTFAKGDARNITVIHGNNGSGKTAVLNAFTWALYEKFTAALASPENLVNRRALAEAKKKQPIECFVEVAFEHDSKQYRIKRSCRAYRQGESVEQTSSELFMQFVGDDGRWSTLPGSQQPEDVIGRILPTSLHKYFFFDGERIEQIVRSGNRSEIAEATQKLLGVKVIDNAIKHLTNARKTLEDELDGIGDAETKSLLAQKREAEKEATYLQDRQLEIDQELTNQATLRQEYSQKLLDLTEVQEQQQRRELLEGQVTELRDRMQEAKKVLKRAISNSGYTVFLPAIEEKFRAIVKDREDKGELPADIKQTFVQELLNRERCICGAELHEGSPNRKAVTAWLQKSGLADVEAATYRIEAQVNELARQREDFWQVVDREQANIGRYRQTLAKVEDDLEDIRDQLRQSPREDIRLLQQRLDETDDSIQSLTLEKGANEEKIGRYKLEAQQLRKQIKDRKLNQSRQKLAQQRIEAAQEAIDRLKQLKANQDERFRQELAEKIQELYGQISFKAYLPRLSERYELSLVESVGKRDTLVGASTGENQILSLAFIGGVIEKVRQWSAEGLVMGPDSSTFPVVMDSPFGSLDEIYRRQVAKLIPALADQLIVMATKTQWRGEVSEEMTERVGREYVLLYNSVKPDCEPDTIDINGKAYPLVRPSTSKFEYTEVIEVKR
ncbi:MAG: AAA family ATPase [Cyanobacteria bacterium P01_A01_bin.114]